MEKVELSSTFGNVGLLAKWESCNSYELWAFGNCANKKDGCCNPWVQKKLERMTKIKLSNLGSVFDGNKVLLASWICRWVVGEPVGLGWPASGRDRFLLESLSTGTFGSNVWWLGGDAYWRIGRLAA